MKAKRTLLLGLAAFLAVLALGVFAVGRLEEEDASPADESIPLADWAAADIERFGIEYGGETLTFVKVELPAEESEKGESSSADSSGIQEPQTEWRLEGEPETALDQTIVNTMLTALASLRADRALGQASEEYGLARPTLTFWATAGGATHAFAVGAENRVTGSVYLQKDGEGEAYLVASSRVTSLQKTRADLLARQTEESGSQAAGSTGGEPEGGEPDSVAAGSAPENASSKSPSSGKASSGEAQSETTQE